MKRIIVVLIFMHLCKVAYAQQPVGLLHDVNGIPFNGYFDPLTYMPAKKIMNIQSYDSYELGHYYDKNGTKIEGLIKFEQDKLFFKKDKEDGRIKILPEEISRFVIGIDSFFVIRNFYYKDKIKDKPEFVQYITTFNGNTFVKHYHFTTAMGAQPSVIETFLVKHKDSLKWDNFSQKNNFKEHALKYFDRFPDLASKIASGHYKEEDMLSIIKTAEYYNKFKNNELIYRDKYGQEVQNKNQATNYDKIVNKKDSIWTIESYKDNVLTYKSDYSSFYPNKKNGDFFSYYPNANIRQHIVYKNDKPTDVKTYSDNGMLQSHYQWLENKNPKNDKIDVDLSYQVVNDTLGNNIIQKNNPSTITFYDDLNKTSYTSNFKNDKLLSYYRMMGADTIFHITDPDDNFSIDGLQSKFDFFMKNKKIDEALSVNAQGTLLVSMLIDDEGYVIESKIHNSIHPEIDNLMYSFVKNRLLAGAEFRYKFKPCKKNKIKKYCEVVIPFEFSIDRFYRKPVNYDYLNVELMMHNQMMMQQNVMMRNIRGF